MFTCGEAGGDEGGDDAPPALSGMGKGIALDVNPAPLPSGAKHLRDGSLDALVRIADDAWPPTLRISEEPDSVIPGYFVFQA